MNTKLPSLTNLQICHFSILLATNKQPAIIAPFLARCYFSPLCCSFQAALENNNNNNKAQKHHNNKHQPPSDKNSGKAQLLHPDLSQPHCLPCRPTSLGHPPTAHCTQTRQCRSPVLLSKGPRGQGTFLALMEMEIFFPL